MTVPLCCYDVSRNAIVAYFVCCLSLFHKMSAIPFLQPWWIKREEIEEKRSRKDKVFFGWDWGLNYVNIQVWRRGLGEDWRKKWGKLTLKKKKGKIKEENLELPWQSWENGEEEKCRWGASLIIRHDGEDAAAWVFVAAV